MILKILTMIAVVAMMVFFNALYVAGEFSTVSARKPRIIKRAEEGNRLAKMLLPVLEDTHKLDRYIAASQVGITLSSLALGIYGERQIAPLFAPLLAGFMSAEAAAAGGEVAAAGVASILVLAILTVLQVILGELVPKSISLLYTEQVALGTVIPMKWSADYILRPLIAVLNGSGILILRLLGADTNGAHTHVHSPEEILLLVKQSREGGLLDEEEERMLGNVFRVGSKRLIEIALPRNRMFAAPVQEKVENVLRLTAESSYTRIPVYEDDIDHIIGFVHFRDLFTLYRRDPSAGLRSILRDVPYFPETLTTTEAWERLKESNSYLAIVFDEYGGTSGLITLEDLVEEVFGELQDEFDQEHEPITRMTGNRLVIRGDVQITRLNDSLGLSLPHREAHTIGGLILDELGRIPKVGDEVTIDDVLIRVETVVNMFAKEVCLMLPPQPAPDLNTPGEVKS